METTTFNPAEQASLVDVLKHRAQATPDKVAYIYLEDGESIEHKITYAELDQQARALAAELQMKNANIQGERILLVYPQGIEFIVAFFGTLYAGATAVLVYPPTSKKMAKRLNGIVEDCRVAQILSTTKVIGKMQRMNVVGDTANAADSSITIAAQDWINTDETSIELAAQFTSPAVQGSDIAFLQYTSGSTGTPKGVMVSHNNLMANQRAIQDIYQHDDSTIFVGWLPLIHDMGLIGNVLQPMYLGIPLTFMSPLHFVQKPVRWLKAISKYRATTSGGPNFAYDLCARKVSEEDMQGLDLSSWEIAFNGAEPVRKETVKRFNDKFKAVGLRPESHMAVYGLAEATLIVTGTEKHDLLSTGGDIEYMSSGKSVAVDTVKVVNPETCLAVADGEEGEIWVNGPSVAEGYWDRPEETQETFHAKIQGSDLSYMRTGDTGYFENGEIHVTGRIKDIIIVQGKNYHAEDVEWSLSEVQGLRAGGCAAFSLALDDREDLVIVAGATENDAEKYPAIISNIRSSIYEDHQLQVDRVVLVKPKEIPMTTSGKVQRRLARTLLTDNEFTILVDDQLVDTAGSNAKESKKSFVAASTPAERDLTAIWSELLGMPAEEIGITDNFFDLGGSSLTMLELANRVNATMELLFRYPTISSYLYRNSEYEFPAVEDDIYLPPSNIDENLTGETNISLITGGTGFFGLHFLQSMMKRTDDKFVLLVRGKTDEAIQKKFDDAVAYFHMEKDIDPARVILMRGDLSEHHVGIPDEQYPWVAENVDKIYHIGSHVNNWLPYEGIREINVDGTRSLLTLARTGRKKEFHYTSTSTFAPDKEDTSVFLEGDSIDKDDINRFFGYDISKYASEEMCRIARDEGLTCNIYRLVWVGGHIDTGLTKVNDGFNIMLRILITIGAFPTGNYLHDIIPVDLMADGMASVQGKAKNTDFNLTSQSKESIDMKRIVVMLRDMGYQIDEVSRAEFVQRLKDYPTEKWDEHCRSYRQLVIRLFEDPTPKIESFYDATNFRTHMDPELLARMEEKFIDTWFEKMVNFLVKSNALPTPTGSTYDQELIQIADWSDNAQAVNTEQCLHHLLDEQAKQTPDAIAVEFGSQQLTYQGLVNRSNQIAQTLIEQGVEAGEIVGLCVERSTNLIAAIFGILKAGCAYLPLDPTYPVQNLDYMIEDCGTSHILVGSQSVTKLSHHDDKLIYVKEDELATKYQDWTDSDLANIAVSSAPTDLAYIVYTSGTTGNPKGVLVEHQNVVNHNFSIIESFGLTAEDKLLQFSTVNFDSFVEEAFTTLFSGGTLVMLRKEQVTDLEQLQAVIRDHQISVLKFSTAFWHTVAELNVERLGVRLVAIGGEEADLAKYNQWREVNPSIPLINTYGPTETTVTASLAVLEGPLNQITIGKPIANTRLHILGPDLKPVPVGFTGELYIAGKGVTRGYLNRPEINAEVFIDNPFNPGTKMYKSGDVVRWTKDGNVEFLGRTDNQVKVRGYRIELGAIESVIAGLPGIKQAVVVLKQVDTKKKIIAYISMDENELDIAAIRQYLELELPSYMLPNMILPLDEIPLNPNGKVDRKVLELMEINAANHVDFATPTSENELKMAAIWESVLGVTNIGLHDDFMELGGHSLMVMSLINEVNKQFDCQMGINDIFEFPTIAKLLASVTGDNDGETSNLIKFPDMPTKQTQIAQSKRPMFLVHGLGGHLASFYPLVKNLKQQLLETHGMDISVYGLEANGFKADQSFFSSLDEMVNTYISLIRETQASGPYLIGGWSYGVSIAYHIAQELIREGEEVELFVSIDAEAPHVPKDFAEFLAEHNVTDLNDLYKDDTLAKLLGNFGQRFGFMSNDKECAKEQFYRFLGYSQGDSLEQVERLSKVAIANLFNAQGFKPSKINPMKTLLVRASQSSFDNYANDWHELLDSKMVSLLTLNGDHWSIMQEPELAEQMAKLLADSIDPEAV